MPRAALCVGINRFARLPDSHWLRGCVNDAEDIAEVLRSGYGFADDEVTVLTDARATKDAIIDRLADMAERAAEGRLDQLVFTYASHGTQVPDDDGDEPDQMDEALAAYDLATAGDHWDRASVIADDELHALLRRIPAEVPADVVLDTCHSGTGLRSFDLLPGRAPRFVPPPTPSGLDAAERADRRGLRDLVGAGPGPVLFAACRADQTASDALFGQRYAGAFTHFWLAALAERPDATRSDTHRAVSAALRAARFSQRAQLEGTPDQRSATWWH